MRKQHRLVLAATLAIGGMTLLGCEGNGGNGGAAGTTGGEPIYGTEAPRDGAGMEPGGVQRQPDAGMRDIQQQPDMPGQTRGQFGDTDTGPGGRTGDMGTGDMGTGGMGTGGMGTGAGTGTDGGAGTGGAGGTGAGGAGAGGGGGGGGGGG